MGLLIFLIASIVVIGSFWYFNVYCEQYKKGCIRKIRFTKFLEIYENAPKKFGLYKGYITYYDNSSDYSAYNFYFSIFETFRYNRWLNKLQKGRELLETNKKYEAVEKCWERDKERYGNTN